MPINVADSPELLAVILTLKRSGAAVRKEMRAAARAEANPQWKPAVEAAATTRLQRAVIAKGARVKVGMQDFELLAATSRRPLSGGLVPAAQWAGAEYGAKRYPQFGPRHKGIARTAAQKVGPRIVAAWINGAVKGLTQANKHMETS
ncbi:MAG: hypothetical protein ACK5O2_00835 [Microthrixaceae bacterium]